MKEKEIFEKIESLRQPIKMKKFIGAMTVEVVKNFLEKEGFRVSGKDSFVEGIPNEIDLLILKKDAKPIFNSYYKSEDILVVFELKFTGLFGKGDIEHISKMFENVKIVNSEIRCVYLTIYENQKYPHKATNKNINGEVFELFKPNESRESAIKKGVFYDSISGDWERLLKFLNDLV